MGYPQGSDNGVLENPKDLPGRSSTRNYKCMADLVAEGENPKGFTSFTPNGVSRPPEDTLVHKANYGRDEDGSHWEMPMFAGVAFSSAKKRKK